jgi:hypothetical protein
MTVRPFCTWHEKLLLNPDELADRTIGLGHVHGLHERWSRFARQVLRGARRRPCTLDCVDDHVARVASRRVRMGVASIQHSDSRPRRRLCRHRLPIARDRRARSGTIRRSAHQMRPHRYVRKPGRRRYVDRPIPSHSASGGAPRRVRERFDRHCRRALVRGGTSRGAVASGEAWAGVDQHGGDGSSLAARSPRRSAEVLPTPPVHEPDQLSYCALGPRRAQLLLAVSTEAIEWAKGSPFNDGQPTVEIRRCSIQRNSMLRRGRRTRRD